MKVSTYFFRQRPQSLCGLRFYRLFFLTHDATYRQLLLPAAALLNVYTMLTGLLFPRIYVVIKANQKAKKKNNRRSYEWTRSTILLSITNQSGSTEFMDTLKTKENSRSRSLSSCDRCSTCGSIVNVSEKCVNETNSLNGEEDVTITKM